ncbi:MAG: hypothetical protein GXO79_10400 [Chlorobi bacterium]|nr:hypothetical protein [Chlorobiota bacterium]
MRLLKYSIVLIILLSITFSIYGQIGADRKEKIEAQKVGYITNRLNLTPKEAQQFWPVYNQYQVEKQDLLNQKKAFMLKYREEKNSLTTEELEVIVDGFVNVQVQEAELLKKYNEKYKTVLPIEKILKLYQAENQFKQFLLKQIKGQGGGTQQRPRRNF